MLAEAKPEQSSEQAVSLALHQEFSVFSGISDFSGFPLLPEGKMKIHLQTKRGLNTLKFGACSEILTLFLWGNWKIRV